MGLSLNNLAAGREVIHDVKITSLGDSIKVRELSAKALEELFKKHADKESGGITQEGVKALIADTLTDDDGADMTLEMVESFLQNSQSSVIREVTKKIIDVHGGSESGES